ncbi:Endo-1,3;1,4-beta-D-glucanase [Vitis vinifera]|uniref:Endo-1,31,4-beta-D-glucanase n=1 Tax=Vitis vinifera TaxID=29760 RepID=A0A438F486_VITVI|nr:Endo-1,3;1,4-beta-D-glucanase [Vitis vinifera]
MIEIRESFQISTRLIRIHHSIRLAVSVTLSFTLLDCEEEMSGPQCCENPPTLSSSSGAGCVTEIGGLKAYVSGPSDSKLAILLISDVYGDHPLLYFSSTLKFSLVIGLLGWISGLDSIFNHSMPIDTCNNFIMILGISSREEVTVEIEGYEAPNLRNLADKVAGAGFYVVVPDFFYGDPFLPETNIPVWIKAHGTDKGFEDAKPIIAELRSKGINAIGAAGFCWGAKVAVELSKAGHIQAAVLLHPSFVTVDDIKGVTEPLAFPSDALSANHVGPIWLNPNNFPLKDSASGSNSQLAHSLDGSFHMVWNSQLATYSPLTEVKAPIAILGAEIDQYSPPKLLKQFEEVLSTKPEVNGYVKIFPGVDHGWSVRYKVEDEEAVKQANEAHQNMMDWFTQKKRTTCLIQWCENPPTLSSSCGGGSVVEVGSLKANVAGPSDSKHSILLVADIFVKKKCQALSAVRIHLPSPPAVELGVLQKFEASRPTFQALLIPSLPFFLFQTFLVTWLNPPTLSSSSGAGCVAEIGGLKAYVSGPSDSKLVIPCFRPFWKLADKVAAAGFYVVVPDFFYGDPFVPETMTIPVWIKAHGMDKGFEDAKPVVAELRSKGINAIGAAGFCWGAKVVVELSKVDQIQAAVLFHPARVTVDDIKEIKAPTAILGAETDHVSPPELLKQFEEVLSTKPEVNGYVKIFPGVAHGWSVRYKVEDEEAVKRADESHQIMMDWFAQYVK